MMTAVKPSGVEGFGDIPENWDVKKTAFLFSFGRGLSISREDMSEEGIPCVHYGDIHGRFGFEVDPNKHKIGCIDERYLRTSRNALLKHGDFLFVGSSEDLEGSGNFTYLNSDTPAFAGSDTIILRAKANIDFRYFAYLFDSQAFREQIRTEVYGVKVFHLTQAIIKKCFTVVPPIEEQRAIAAILDDRCGQIDGIIADAERQVEILRKYRKTLIAETVTKGLDKTAPMKDSGIDWIGEIPKHWEVKRIKHSTSIMGSGTTPESGNADFYDGNIPWIQSGDLYNRDVILETEKTITPLAIKTCSALKHYQNDFIVVAMYGASVGNVAISKISGYVNQACCVLIPNKMNDGRYLYYWLKTCKDDLVRQSFGGGQPNISQLKIKNEPYLQAPFLEQQELADFLDEKCAEVDTLISEKQRSIEIMRQYKRSLIYEYVTGKKRIANWNKGGETHADKS